MNYGTLSKLIEVFQNENSDDDEGIKMAGRVRVFSELPHIISMSGKKIAENTYASANYYTDLDSGEHPEDEQVTEAYVSIRIVQDLPEEKSRAEIINAKWIFTASGIEQVEGEPSDVMIFFEEIKSLMA